MSTPWLSIIVPSNRPVSSVRPLLNSLQVQSRATNSLNSWELIWIVNGQPLSECQKVLSEIRNVELRSRTHMLYRPLANANQARNAGAEVALGQVLFFMDDDLELVDGDQLQRIIERCWSEIERRGSLWALGGEYALGQSNTLGRSYFRVTRQFLQQPQESGQDFLLGGFLVLPKVLFEKIAGFNEARAWGGTELSINRRLRAQRAFCQRVETWSLRHHLLLSYRQYVLKGLGQGEGARDFPDFQVTAVESYDLPSWNIKRYQLAFHVGLFSSWRLRFMVRRFPFLVDIFLIVGILTAPVLHLLTLGLWKFLWHALHVSRRHHTNHLAETEALFAKKSAWWRRQLSLPLFLLELARRKKSGRADLLGANLE